MKKLVIIIMLLFNVIILLQLNLSANSTDNQYWRDFVYDKQAWELGPVNRIVTYGEKFFASGYFAERFYDSLFFNGIAELQDSLWLPLGTGFTAGVRGEYFAVINDLLIKDSILYVVGIFDSVGNISSKNIAIWNINSRNWVEFPYKVNGPIVSIVECNNKLYIGGRFDTLYTVGDTIYSKNIASWDGSNWNSLENGINRAVQGMYAYEDEVYVVGEFDSVNNIFARGIGIWNDSTESWSTFGQYGPDGVVINVVKAYDGVYFSGYFDSVNTSTGIIAAKNITRWDGSSWNALDDGIDGHIHRLKSYYGGIIVAGDFTKFQNDTIECKNIVFWNGYDWQFFGTGTNEGVRDVTLWGDSLMVGGEFLFTGDSLATNIGLWYIPQQLLIEEKILQSTQTGYDIYIIAYPNPAKEEVEIEFFIEVQGSVEILAYDVAGNNIENILKGNFKKGWHKTTWSVSRFDSGIYFINLKINGKSTSTKLAISR